MRELRRQTRASHGCIGVESVLDFFWHLGTHRGRENARGNSGNSDVKLAEVTCHRKNDSIDGSLARTVRNLSALSLLCGDAAYEKNHSFLTLFINGLVF